MPRRSMSAVACAVASLLVAACGGGGDEGQDGARGLVTTTTARAGALSTTTRPAPVIGGVETFTVDAGHQQGTIDYPHTPPVGGLHNPAWTNCGYYDQPVPNERTVHSLEHGAIWITYRPDVPAADVEQLAALARSRKDVLVSPWPEGLPAPLVVTGWGRQLRVESVADPRLMQFVTQYANQGPEINAPC